VVPMPYCPNPKCPFRERHGESAEFVQGTKYCSDCDTPLTTDDILGKAPKKTRRNRAEFYKRIIWTLVLLGFWRILAYLSLPGINDDAFSRMASQDKQSSFRFTILALGLMPYIYGYILVEALALFVKPLKRWRSQEGQAGRLKLVRTARLVTLVLAVVHGSFLLSGMSKMFSGQIFIDPGLVFRSVLVLTLVAGTFLTIWIADMISMKGIGHGISILIIASYVAGLPRDIIRMVNLSVGENKFIYFVLPVLIVIGLISLVIFMEKAYRKTPVQFENGTDSYIPIKLTTAGTVPSAWANSMTAALSLFLMPSMSGGQQVHDILLWLAVFFGPGQAGRLIAYSIFVVFFYYLFTAFFYNPRQISAYLKDRTAEFKIPSEGDSHFVNRSLERMAVIGCLYFLGIILFVEIAGRVTQIMVFALDGVKLIVMVCIALDLANEVSMRWKSQNLVNVAEFQEPWKAGLLKNVLQQNKIPCVIRGYYHRALMYFFGPFVEMSVFVPAEKAKAATDQIDSHGRPGY